MSSPLDDLLPYAKRAVAGRDLPPLVDVKASYADGVLTFHLQFRGSRAWSESDFDEMDSVHAELLADFENPPIGSRIEWMDDSQVLMTVNLLEDSAELPEQLDHPQP